jgi:hypothetical protein
MRSRSGHSLEGCLDHVIVLSDRHLKRVLSGYLAVAESIWPAVSATETLVTRITIVTAGSSMLRGNRRGPEGMGPITGRGLGYCAGSEQPGFSADALPRGGAGYGRGYGSRSRGWQYRPYPVATYDVTGTGSPLGRGTDLAKEVASLKERIKALAERLAGSEDGD